MGEVVKLKNSLLNEIMEKNKELKRVLENRRLGGNEAYFMVNSKVISAGSFLSGLETKDSSIFKPKDPTAGGKIKELVKGLCKEELDCRNLSHSEQRIILLLDFMIKNNLIEKRSSVKIFTGRKCCSTCRKILKNFFETHNEYGIEVIDFWNVGKDKLSTSYEYTPYNEEEKKYSSQLMK